MNISPDRPIRGVSLPKHLMPSFRLAWVAVSVLAAALIAAPATRAATTFTVNTTADNPDFSAADGVCDVDDSTGDGPCTLRAAIQQANATPGLDTISFAIPGPGPHTIVPGAALPDISDSLFIDGWSQGGAGYMGPPLIELDGGAIPATILYGFRFYSTQNTVRGLAISRFETGILIIGSSGNWLYGNYIGLDPTGTFLKSTSGNEGITLMDSVGNIIGGANPGDRNVIAGGFRGVWVRGAASHTNVIQGNYLGLDATGTTRLQLGLGILITDGSNNLIGGPLAGAGNVAVSGIFLDRSDGNVVVGNLLGVDVTGTVALATHDDGWGIHLSRGSEDNVIGGTFPAARNVVAGFRSCIGIVDTAAATQNIIQGNYIGTDITGTAALGCTQEGIGIENSSNILIGGMASGAGNVIGWAGGSGIRLLGGISSSPTTNVTIQGNFVGTDATGTATLGNQFADGIRVVGIAPGNLIGGTDSAARNLISGWGSGIFIDGTDASGNTIQGNYLGTDITGTVALGNILGVRLRNTSGQLVGGSGPGAGNLISASHQGVALENADFNRIAGNYIGTDVTGTVALRVTDGGRGVIIRDGSDGNVVGGLNPVERNLISGHYFGVLIEDNAAATPNVVQGNFIGTDYTGTALIGNPTPDIMADVHIVNASNNIIGGDTVGAGNVISGGAPSGVWVLNTTDPTTDNVIAGNRIGTDVFGATALGGHTIGVRIEHASYNTVGGAVPAARNLISGNGAGIIIFGSRGTGNTVQGNYIGTEITGTAALPNDSGVVISNTGNLIGGNGPGQGNVISGNTNAGITLGGANASQNAIYGNRIGVSAADAPLGNGSHGVSLLTDAGGNFVGSTTAGTGNVIAYNGGDGVHLATDAGHSNRILQNSIFSNGGLGIDLGADGVTPNDPLDADTGPNRRQNYPILTTATSLTETVIVGTLNSLPNETFRIEFYVSPTCDPSGSGEGQTLIGWVELPSDASGSAPIFTTLGTVVPEGHFITATATATGTLMDTAEFSPCVEVVPPTAMDLIDDIIVDVQEIEDAGLITPGVAASLIGTLERASAHAERGNTTAAINTLNAFRSQVDGLVRGNQMPFKQGQSLNDSAAFVIIYLGGTPR